MAEENKVSMLTDKTGAISSMRVSLLMIVITACCVALGGVAGFIISICLNNGTIAIVGACLGGIAGIIGALLAPAMIGKSAQSFAESQEDKKNG